MKAKYTTNFMLALVVTILSGITSICAQEIKNSLFSEADRVMALAKEAQADILSPRYFNNGMDAYTEAAEDYANEKELKEIRESLNEAVENFNQALNNVSMGEVLFTQTLAARADANNANAQTHVSEIWKEAEEAFEEAAEELEKGDADDAKEKATEAEQLYREAELKAIEANYLDNARRLVAQAEDDKVDKVAPRSLLQAKNMIKLSETALVENRYDTDEARYFSKEAEYQANLAMYIAEQNETFEEKDYESEDYMLMAFESPRKIGEALDLNLKFDEGIEKTTQQIIAEINQYQNENSNLRTELYETNQRLQFLELQLEEQRKLEQALQGQMTEEAAQARERQRQLQSRIDRLAEIDDKFDQIQQMFKKDEALVFRQKNDVIIRLIGVNFDVGKSQIKQEDYSLLAKLQKALNIFENTDIVIEGHTDSQGSDKTNLKLSQDRADAVLSYLEANSTINKERYSTQGYGESKPVANNETEDGRRQNRRIDVVIQPDLEQNL